MVSTELIEGFAILTRIDGVVWCVGLEHPSVGVVDTTEDSPESNGPWIARKRLRE